MLKKVDDLERLLDYIERKCKLGQNALRDMQYTTIRLDYILKCEISNTLYIVVCSHGCQPQNIVV